jgi:hypothetical protein
MEIIIPDYADGIAITGNLQRNGKIFMIIHHRILQRTSQRMCMTESQVNSLKNEQMGLGQKKLATPLGC